MQTYSSDYPSKRMRFFFGLTVLFFFQSCVVTRQQTMTTEVSDSFKKMSNLEKNKQQLVDAHMVERPAKDLVLSFVGDVIIHERLRRREVATGEGYQVIWSAVQKYLNLADLRYANLEGPVAPDLAEPSGFPRFNYPENILISLKQARFDLVSTANNHALDRGFQGVQSNLKFLKKHHLSHTGTISDETSLLAGHETWWSLTKLSAVSSDKKIAWISCTEMTNGIRDIKHQVLYCYKDKKLIFELINQLKHQDDIAAIILLPHWGEEEVFDIEAHRRRWAHLMLEQGASAIVGSHPHVIQKIEHYITRDQRQTLIAYSLGNFISNQPWIPNKTSMMLFLKFSLDKAQSKAVLKDVKALPLWMNRSVASTGTTIFRVVPGWLEKKIPDEARDIWFEQIGEDKILKSDAETLHFLSY